MLFLCPGINTYWRQCRTKPVAKAKMGVQGLWELLAPVGRRVSVETLAGKKLAIGNAYLLRMLFLTLIRSWFHYKFD